MWAYIVQKCPNTVNVRADIVQGLVQEVHLQLHATAGKLRGARGRASAEVRGQPGAAESSRLPQFIEGSHHPLQAALFRVAVRCVVRSTLDCIFQRSKIMQNGYNYNNNLNHLCH